MAGEGVRGQARGCRKAAGRLHEGTVSTKNEEIRHLQSGGDFGGGGFSRLHRATNAQARRRDGDSARRDLRHHLQSIYRDGLWSRAAACHPRRSRVSLRRVILGGCSAEVVRTRGDGMVRDGAGSGAWQSSARSNDLYRRFRVAPRRVILDGCQAARTRECELGEGAGRGGGDGDGSQRLGSEGRR